MRYPDIQIFSKLNEECAPVANKMVLQMKVLLRGPIKLPLLIRVISHLGQVMELTPIQLATCFLQQRNAYMTLQLGEIKAVDAIEYCRKYVDISSNVTLT